MQVLWHRFFTEINDKVEHAIMNEAPKNKRNIKTGKDLGISEIVRIFATLKPEYSMDAIKIQQIIADYFRTQPVLKAYIFGSFSRGEQRDDSDIDILVAYDRNQRVGLFKISEMHLALEELLGRKVDLVDESSLFPWVADRVNREKRLIYERAA